MRGLSPWLVDGLLLLVSIHIVALLFVSLCPNFPLV